MTSIERLASLGGPALAPPVSTIDGGGGIPPSVIDLLRAKNGFYCFESALHVFPASTKSNQMDLITWNSENLWRHAYGKLVDGCFFFAEDIFGGQFCIADSKIHSFDPETGELQLLASEMEGWAETVLNDFDVLTGHKIAHDWQVAHGPLQAGHRLVPKMPFVTGGEYSLGNLVNIEAAEGMRFRGNVARQIHGLPDGSKVRFKISEE